MSTPDLHLPVTPTEADADLDALDRADIASGNAPPRNEHPSIHARDGAVTAPLSPATSRRKRTRAALDERLRRPSPTVWVSGQEAAEYVGVSWPTLRQLILDQSIPHVRLGTRWKIDVGVLDEHLQRLAQLQAQGS